MRALAVVLALVPALRAQAFEPPRPLALDLPAPTSERDGAAWAGDLDRDGKPDLLLVVRTERGARLVALHSGRAQAPYALGAPVFVRAASDSLTTPEGCEAELTPRLCDLDGDGWPDLVTAANPRPSPAFAFARTGAPLRGSHPQPVVWFRGGAQGFADEAPVLAATQRPLLVQDRAIADAAKRNAADERSDPAQTCLEPRCVVPVDWDGDGRLDLVVQTKARLLVHLAGAEGFGHGVALHDATGELDVGGELDPWLVDADRDGTVDLFTVLPDASIGLRRGRRGGDGLRFGQPRVVVAANEQRAGRRLAVADWDGDRRPDLVLVDNVVDDTPAVALDAAELATLARAETELARVRQQLEDLGRDPPRLTAAVLRERRIAREALQAQADPHRVLAETLRRKRDGYSSYRLQVQVCRQQGS